MTFFDVKLAEALDDRGSFRRFCGFSGTGATPERTAFVRFGTTLIAQRPDRLLFEMVTAQLKARAITVKTGTPVDATIMASASEQGGDARGVKPNAKPAVHRVCGRVGKIIGIWKRSYGLRPMRMRMRWRGTAKAACQIHLTAITCYLKRTLDIVSQAG